MPVAQGVFRVSRSAYSRGNDNRVPILEPEPRAEAPFPLVVLPAGAIGRGNASYAVQRADRSVRVKGHVRNVRRRVTKVRRVRDVEHLCPDLQRLALADAEHTEQAHVDVRRGRPPPLAVARIAEA